MWVRLLLPLIAAGGVWFAAVAEADAQEAPLNVIVHLKEGEPIEGTLEGFTGTQVRVRAQVGVGSAERTIPTDAIDYILFGEEPGEEQLLTSPEYERDAEALTELYARKRRFLGVPRNNAGEVALAYVRLALGEARRRQETAPHDAADEPEPDTGENGELLLPVDESRLPLVVHERALRLCQEVEAGDWNEERKVESRLLRLELMLLWGDREAVVAEAAELAERTRNLGVHLEARWLLSEAAFEELRLLVEDHPRWFQDEVIRPQRDRLFHETLDGFFYPSLFHATREEQAARGLMGAARAYEHAGELPLAVACAIDVMALYPDTGAVTAAREMLERHPPEQVAEELVTWSEADPENGRVEDGQDGLIDDPLLRSMREQLQRRRVTPLEDGESPEPDPAEPPDPGRFDDEEF